MPVGFNSPARNLFLLGSTGAQVVTNFFKTIDQSAGTDGVYLPDEIKYNIPDQKYILAGSASDSQSKSFGWFEKRIQAGSADWGVKIQSTINATNTTIRALEIDNNDNLIVVGKTGTVPWVAKYTNGGVISWQLTTNTAGLEYSGIAIDSSNNIYACGNTPTIGSSSQAFVEKFDSSGNPSWGKSAFMVGRDVILTKCAVNSRGEVIAVGIIEDDSAYKGYIVKINANTGDVLWDRTIRSYEVDISFGYEPTFCEDVYVDGNDQIYVVGRLFGISETRSFIIKYSPEGNMLWQRETPSGETIQHYHVKSDTETEQTIVFSQYFGLGGILSKYSKNGDLLFRRVIYSSYNSSTVFGPKGLDADPSSYYVLYVDDVVNALSGTPKRYTFGKVSSSGNGFGNFTYSEGTGQTIYYQILNVQDKIGKLSDGSVRQDTSDLLTYPFNANKILFDDLATQIANKKVQIDEPNTFQYGDTTTPTIAYPKISPDAIVYDSSLLLNYDFKNKSCFNLNHNIVSYSENLNSWVFGGTSTVSSNIIASPIGTITADLLDLSLSPTNNMLYQGVTLVTGKTYTLSLWIKSVDGTTGTWGVNFYDGGHNRTTVPITGEWVRVSYTFTPTQQSVNIYPGDNRSSLANKNQAYIWGIQLEQASIPGTYVYTNASPVLYPTSTNNLSSTSYTGTITGTTFNSAGYFDFDGVNDDISVGSSFTLSDTNPVTIESWVNADTTTNTFQVIATAQATSTHWQLSYAGDPTYNILWAFAGTSNSVGTTTLPSLGTWHHIVATYNGGDKTQLASWKVYIDGSSATIQLTGSTGAATNATTIGFRTGGAVSNRFDGKIGETRIYNKALSAAEVSQNFNATRAKYGV
jgi:hypothetical protein